MSIVLAHNFKIATRYDSFVSPLLGARGKSAAFSKEWTVPHVVHMLPAHLTERYIFLCCQ